MSPGKAPIPQRGIGRQTGEVHRVFLPLRRFVLFGETAQIKHGRQGQAQDQRCAPNEVGGNSSGNGGAYCGDERPEGKGHDQGWNHGWDDEGPKERRNAGFGEKSERGERHDA